MKLSPEQDAEVDTILDQFKGMDGIIVPLLQEVNEKYKYLPEPIMRAISHKLEIPVGVLYRIATLYNAFSRVPRGKYVVNVCMGTACYVKGSQRLLESFERELKIKNNETTPDMMFSLSTINCIGCCGQSPVVSVNEDLHGYVKQSDIPKILNSCT